MKRREWTELLKRRAWILAMLCVAVLAMAACQGKAPTAPSDTRDRSGNAPASGVANHEWSDDDDDDDDDDHDDDDDDDDWSALAASLTATPSTIEPGQSATLTWTSRGASAVYLDGRSVALNGSQTTSPTSTRTYYLVAVNGWNRVRRSATVTVSTATPPAPTLPTATLTAMPASIQSGQQTTLTWRTTDATSVTMNGNPVALSGSQAYSPAATTTYTLVASNAAGSTTAIATVTVSEAPPPVPMPTATLTATPPSIRNGQQTALAWVTSNATSVTLNGTPVAANGSLIDFPTATTTYTLVASNASGSTTATATVTVTMPPPVPTASLTASPANILTGESSTLSWTTTDATTVTLNGASVPSSGTQVVLPAQTATYTLVASNESGSITRSTTVTVTAPVVPLTYVNDVKPILDASCRTCHSGPEPTLGYDVSTYAGVMTRVTPFDVNSRLIQKTRPGGSMHGFLGADAAAKAEIIRRWIVEFGAPQQ